MTSTSTDALRLQGVTKQYGTRRAPLVALEQVDLTVPRGQLFGLIGHNGAGKSTLFKLVLGLITASAGQIQVNGCDVAGRDFRAVRRTLGYLPENLVLYDNLSGLETLHFFARLKGAPLSQCATLLEQVGLARAALRPVREYSKGMRQRLGFAQALLGAPQLLLLDEPTTGLDPSAIRDFYEQLQALRARGVTLVISTHVLAELEHRVDALAILSNGRIRAHGTVHDLRERSRMPLTLRMEGSEAQLQTLVDDLLERWPGPPLEMNRPGAGMLLVRCPREHKMALLEQVTRAGLTDLQIQEPSLEDVYFGMSEAP